MNGWTALVVHNVAIISLVGFGMWVTHSAWPLLGLLFLASAEERCDVEGRE